MTYASNSTNCVGRPNAAAISNALAVFRTRKKSVRSVSCESPSSQARPIVETRAEVIQRKVFEEMFVASRPKFVATAYSIVRNREDAEDAVQDAFLSGYLHLRSFEGRSALSTWFTRIVFNAALMMQRKRKPSRIQPFPESSDSPEVDWTENIPASQADPETIHAERETLKRIEGILGKMKPTLRQAFTMTYYEGLSRSEACAVLGVSPGAFKARAFRARRRVLDQTELPIVARLHKTTTAASELFERDGSRAVRDLNS